MFVPCRWRGRMQLVLHHTWLHLVIVFLVALDALIVIFELLLDIGAFSKETHFGFNRTLLCVYSSCV